MKTYVTTFKVNGSGQFPMDMLRYDCCYPLGTDDAAMIFETLNSQRMPGIYKDDIFLRHVCNDKNWKPTIERWRSFGWYVVHGAYNTQALV